MKMNTLLLLLAVSVTFCAAVQCVLPESQTEVNIYPESELNNCASDSCDNPSFVNVTCADGFTGEPELFDSPCYEGNPVVQVNGCDQLACTLPDEAAEGYFYDPEGHFLGGCRTRFCSNYYMAGVLCADGYEGTPEPVQCTLEDTISQLTGCSLVDCKDLDEDACVANAESCKVKSRNGNFRMCKPKRCKQIESKNDCEAAVHCRPKLGRKGSYKRCVKDD